MTKEEKRIELNFKYNEAINGPIECEYGGDKSIILAGGLEMIFKMNLVNEHLALTNGTDTVIRDYIGTNHPLAKAEFDEVRQQYLEQGMAFQQHKTELLLDLENATTEEEIDAIQW